MRAFVTALTLAVLTLWAASARATIQPVFNLEEGWNNPNLQITMDPFWEAFGLPDRGTNFYTTGAPDAGSQIWDRFDPHSPFYQAWFGSYVVSDFPAPQEWPAHCPAEIPLSIANVQAITQVDQLAWLHGFGDPAPQADFGETQVFGPDGAGFFLMVATIYTHSDLGGGQLLGPGGVPVPSLPFYPIVGGAFDPAAFDVPSAYAPVQYVAEIRFKYDVPSAMFLVIYASQAAWSLADGTRHETSSEVAFGQVEMLLGTTFQ